MYMSLVQQQYRYSNAAMQCDGAIPVSFYLVLYYDLKQKQKKQEKLEIHGILIFFTVSLYLMYDLLVLQINQWWLYLFL